MSDVIRYRSIQFEKPLAKILPSGVMESSFLASDGFIIERDLADPMTVRVSHPRGLAAHDVPWSRVQDSERLEGAKEEARSTPAACKAPEPASDELPVAPGAMSEESREALERDGVRIAAPRRAGKKGWPKAKKGPVAVVQLEEPEP